MCITKIFKPNIKKAGTFLILVIMVLISIIINLVMFSFRYVPNIIETIVFDIVLFYIFACIIVYAVEETFHKKRKQLK